MTVYLAVSFYNICMITSLDVSFDSINVTVLLAVSFDCINKGYRCMFTISMMQH